ncbi:MAG: 3-keto-disaccharide hydrolase [Candidatus Binatia bacterium]
MKRLTFISMGLLAIGLTIFGCATQSSREADTGWITLIDGAKGLDNWHRVGTANWTAAEGVIQADKSEKDAGFLVSKNSYGDFVIRVEFWVSDDANSGIYMRCADPKTITDKSCYEANIFDQRPDPSYGTGAIMHLAKISPMPKAGGKWNTYEITAKGSRLTVMLNGVRTVEVEDSQFARGPIALQWGRGVVKFRKVQIKPLN